MPKFAISYLLKVVLKVIYKVVRSIIFSVTLFVTGIYVLTYILVSIPSFTNYVKDRIAYELSVLTGGTIEITELNIYPFNEVIIKGLEVIDPEGHPCVSIETVGAGISLWKLLRYGDIEISYGEILGLEAFIEQKEKDSALNIRFLIDAFASKDDKKKKKSFELALKNVVLRKSSATFSRPWIKNQKIGTLDMSELRIEDLAADIAFPKISDKEIEVDLRRLSFLMPDILKLEKLGLKGKFGGEGLFVENFILEFPQSRIFIPEIALSLEGENPLETIKREHHVLTIEESYVTPSEFSFINPILNNFTEPLNLNVNVAGNVEKVEIENFYFGTPNVLTLTLAGSASGLENINNLEMELSSLSLNVKKEVFAKLSTGLNLPRNIQHALGSIGDLDVKGEFTGALSPMSFQGNIELNSDMASLTFEGALEKGMANNYKADGELNVAEFKINELFPNVPVGNVSLNLIADAAVENNNPEGYLSLVVDDFELKGKRYDGFSINLNKEAQQISGDLMIHNDIADIEGVFSGDIEGDEKSADLNMDIQRLNLTELMDMKAYNGYIISGEVNVDGRAVGIDDLYGEISLNKFSFVSPDETRKLRLNKLTVEGEVEDSIHSIKINSDWFDLRAEGPYKLKELPKQIMALAESVFPALIPANEARQPSFMSDMELDFVIKKNNTLPEFFNLPFRFLVPVTMNASIDGHANTASFTLNVPYLQQGKDKLIYDSKVIADIDGKSGVLDALIETTLPVKKGDLALNVNFTGKENTVSTDLHWANTENSSFKGHLSLDTELGRNHLTSKPEIKLTIQPSVLQMGTAEWQVGRSELTYTDKYATIKGLKIWHDDQFVEVEGTASPEYSDAVTVSLADIDVDYVFDMLQINYVTFGGTATGEVAGRALLSGNPVAETEGITITDFTYNGCQLGTCVATSRWNNEQKEIEIAADITQFGRRTVRGSGGIWLGRDSLCFDLLANKVPVDFVQPFMEVFSSHVGGFATGEAKLYGNFHDIDMTGRIFADSVAVKLDYTNTIYHGSDSVFLYPGRIEIPHFELFDKNDHSAMLTGELTHRYFHDPSFTFRLTDANDFLCYDTSAELNPDWYGTLYGSGSAFLRGVPGVVNISADMTVGGNSVFTFVLNDTQYAQDYKFLTFSDRRKEAMIEKSDLPLTVEDYKEMLKKRMEENEGSLSKFGIDIRATVTPQVLFTLVMDPAAGDKITARGRGAMQVKYESDDDEMMMYGKYEIDEGNYNFSLQDIILRDFKIKEGSYITFNGNPLRADMDISATYRVNTNLSDLDKSFSTDRDLNRTNVPVDAVLTVSGNMQAPDITFDIELPTLTQDVERKVKSIISTDDMMNRQIIYLLALNRFYTPEYMGNSGNGGELAAVASSTISSQLSNILGQLTDKLSVSPSFRSDKGDFSDIEVDVALSSRLLNNRLLINGNFGYRDHSTSSTTFVGDFDVEYLLSKNGNLRLKAYNHFNDQNYYLREALTTQGLGVIYRRDFDDWFTFLKKKDRKEQTKEETSEEKKEQKEETTEQNVEGKETENGTEH